MKRILYIISALSLLISCTKQELIPDEQGTMQMSFNISIEEPDFAPQSRGTAEVSRYLLEIYEENLAATPVKMNNTTGRFDVSLAKGVEHICLFWADDGVSYDVADLKTVKLVDETARGTAAYCTKAYIYDKTDGDITLRRAVAELSFIDKNGIDKETNSLKITYPYSSAVFNVGSGKVNYVAGATVRNISGITPPTDPTTAFTSDLILASTLGSLLQGLRFRFNNGRDQFISTLLVQANFRTKITGVYETHTASMNMTIDTRKNLNNTADATFCLPMVGVLSGYELTVDWGDGTETKYPDGTDLTLPNSTHTYSKPGVYTVTITSTQLNPKQDQIPKINFLDNSGEDNNNKLVVLNSPLLNMGNDLSNCFNGCQNLISISENLFINNTAATTFDFCFSRCESLTSIPAGLFATNTAATNFKWCFDKCTALTSIPAGLFDNTSADDFSSCFSACTALTSIPAGLFDNTNATEFNSCFSACTALTSIPAGLFDNNTAATNFHSCFKNCTALTSIPAGLFDNNTKVGLPNFTRIKS